MEELKKLAESLPDASADEIVKQVPKLMELVKQIGFAEYRGGDEKNHHGIGAAGEQA